MNLEQVYMYKNNITKARFELQQKQFQISKKKILVIYTWWVYRR